MIADHQRRSPENLGCRECGTKLDPEHLLCDECRQREQEQAPDQLCGTVPPPGNVPRLPGGERGLKGTVPINPPDGQEAVRGTRGPPGYAPADDAVARGLCTACTECKGRTGARLYRIGEKYFCSCQWPDPWEAAASAWGLRP